jgi:hypothetical protein
MVVLIPNLLEVAIAVTVVVRLQDTNQHHASPMITMVPVTAVPPALFVSRMLSVEPLATAQPAAE